MASTADIRLETSDLKKRTLSRTPPTSLLTGIGVVLIAVAVGMIWTPAGSGARFWQAWLLAATYCISISLGALFFVLLQHLTRAGWSVAVRRVAEFFAQPLPILGLLLAPVLIAVLWGDSRLYEWNDAAVRSSDPLVASKTAYLNAPFFAVRTLIYFGVWLLLTRLFVGGSLRQDRSRGSEITLRLERYSGPAMMAFAVTVCFAAFDWLMSLDPHWFSTIYGIYFFSGAVVGFFATICLAVLILEKSGPLHGVVQSKHLHDLGKLLFGFTFFWAYIALSQYLLIWYANIPEETSWYLTRQSDGWQWLTVFLFVGHFGLPFLGLMSRFAKRSRASLAFWSLWLLVMHWLDLYWLIMPGHTTSGPTPSPIDLLLTAGLLAIFLSAVLHLARGKAVVPYADPRLHESL